MDSQSEPMELECQAITAALSAPTLPCQHAPSMVWLLEAAPWLDSSLDLARGLDVLELGADTLPHRA